MQQVWLIFLTDILVVLLLPTEVPHLKVCIDPNIYAKLFQINENDTVFL